MILVTASIGAASKLQVRYFKVKTNAMNEMTLALVKNGDSKADIGRFSPDSCVNQFTRPRRPTVL